MGRLRMGAIRLRRKIREGFREAVRSMRMAFLFARSVWRGLVGRSRFICGSDQKSKGNLPDPSITQVDKTCPQDEKGCFRDDKTFPRDHGAGAGTDRFCYCALLTTVAVLPGWVSTLKRW